MRSTRISTGGPRYKVFALFLSSACCTAAAPGVSAEEAWKPGGERVGLEGITFDSTIHCGNAHGFVKVGSDHYRFRARVGREPYAWRFYFKIECPKAVGREITLEVADFNHAGRTPFHESATVWSTDGRQWNALQQRQIEIVPYTPSGRAEVDARYGDREHIPYGVRYRLRLAGPVMWFAAPTPYTLKHRDECLERLAAAHPGLVRTIAVGHTRHSPSHGYPIRAVRIAAPGDNPQRRTIVVIAGEHSSETAGMYACEGWMEEVLAHRDWLDRYTFCFVPIVNVDGVYYGTSYYNLPAVLTDGKAGENVSVGFREPRLPEAERLWPLLVQWRPVFFASLHNGRHRTALEALGPQSPGTDALLAAWRRELGLPLERVTSRAGTRAWNVLSESGITPLAYTIETLLLCCQKGCSSFQESYMLTGRQLARGTVAALDALPPEAKQSAAAQAKSGDKEPPPAQIPCLRMAGDDFVAQLPWFYHGLPFERFQDHHIYSFEANGLPLPAGKCKVAVVPKGEASEIEVGFDGRTFARLPAAAGRVELPQAAIRNRMLSFYVRAADVESSPVQSVFVMPAGKSLAEAEPAAVPFQAYQRKIRLEEREILHEPHWDEFHRLLYRPGFGKKQLRTMFDEIRDWCVRRQVLEPGDPHYGAIHSEEDKYDFRDAAAAAVCFAHAWRDTGNEDYHRRALLARSYAHKGQHREDPANKQQYGGFCQMVDGKWGEPFKRLGKQLPKVTGVETCIIANLLVRSFELGLAPSPDDLQCLQAAATWLMNSEFQPGVFHHHEGSTTDCQNSNILGAMALARACQALETFGQPTPAGWREAAFRGCDHYIEGQEAVGCWPYLFASIGRGQAFREHNIPDQGMGVYHFLVAGDTPALRARPGIDEALKRAARWWLSMSRIDREPPFPTIDLDDRLARGDLKFSAFTWCRFMAAASLARIAQRTGEKEPWRQLALRYMEHVHTKLWNRTDSTTAPVRRATRAQMTLCSWIQAAEWDAVLLREIEDLLP